MEILKLKLIGEDSWGRPIYKDQNGKLWKDVTLGSEFPSLYSSSRNDFDGEPDIPIRQEYLINDSDGNNE